MTTPARPEWVKITGPRGARYVTVGRVYRVLGWTFKSPIIHHDDGKPYLLEHEGRAGTATYPAWEPCVGPTEGGS